VSARVRHGVAVALLASFVAAGCAAESSEVTVNAGGLPAAADGVLNGAPTPAGAESPGIADPAIAGADAPPRSSPALAGGGPAPDPSDLRIQPCAGYRVNVSLTPEALRAATGLNSVEESLRLLAVELLAASGHVVTPDRIEVSPAIRAFRVTAGDSATATSMVRRLRESDGVAAAALDSCAVRVQTGTP
jgi:hypothetical protein